MIDNAILITKQTLEKEAVKRIKSVLPDVKITKENLDFNPHGEDYIFMSCQPGASIRLNLGNEVIGKRRAGVLGFVVYTQLSSLNGSDVAYDRAGVIADCLEDIAISDTENKVKIVCDQASCAKLGVRESYFAVSVVIPFTAEYVKC